MRPNIEEIRELANKATKGPWKVGREHGESEWSNRLPNGSDVIVSWGTQWALGLDVAAVPYKNTWDGQFIANARTDIPALLAYIDELENMPLVQTVVKLQEENSHLHNELEVWKHATKAASETIDSLRLNQEINQLNLNQEKLYKSVSTLENFLHDHQNGEFTWDEVTNVFGPNDAIALVKGIKIKDEIITRYLRIEQDLMDDCNQYERRIERLKTFLSDAWEVLRMEREFK